MAIQLCVNFVKDIQALLVFKPKNAADRKVQNYRMSAIALPIIGSLFILSSLSNLSTMSKKTNNIVKLGFCALKFVLGYDMVIIGRNRSETLSSLCPNMNNSSFPDNVIKVVKCGVTCLNLWIDREHDLRDTLIANDFFKAWNEKS